MIQFEEKAKEAIEKEMTLSVLEDILALHFHDWKEEKRSVFPYYFQWEKGLLLLLQVTNEGLVVQDAVFGPLYVNTGLLTRKQ